MLRKFANIFLCLVLISGITAPASAAGITANPTTSGVAVNGNNICCAAYTIDGSNYFKLRDLAAALDFSVTWDTNTIRIDTSKPYIPGGSESTAPATHPATATPAVSKVTLNGAPMEWTAYTIGGSNYFKLRDVLKALDLFVFFSAEFNVVGIITDRRYEEERPKTQAAVPPQTQQTVEVIADGSGRLSATPITKKVLDGSDMAREDFSRYANPAIFDGVYTRAAYNAIRQTILDKDIILSGSNEKGFNPYYNYAHVIATPEIRNTIVYAISGTGRNSIVSVFAEPYLENYYLYPDYMAFTLRTPILNERAEQNVSYVVNQSEHLNSDTDTVKLLNDFLCDKMDYDISADSGINTVFSSTTKVRGQCSSFANAFSYLCDRAGIPCVIVTGGNHAWNVVYADGAWLYVDVSANTKVDNRASLLLSPTSRKTDENPKSTAFAKELLVPGSTR